MNENTKKEAIKAYLEYWNDFLTVERFAEHRGISETKAVLLINRGRSLYNTNEA
jgi:hypothetical protein